MRLWSAFSLPGCVLFEDWLRFADESLMRLLVVDQFSAFEAMVTGFIINSESPW